MRKSILVGLLALLVTTGFAFGRISSAHPVPQGQRPLWTSSIPRAWGSCLVVDVGRGGTDNINTRLSCEDTAGTIRIVLLRENEEVPKVLWEVRRD